LKVILKTYLIRINNGGTPTSAQNCGNVAPPIKRRERRAKNSDALDFKSVAGYTTTINQLKHKRRNIYS
jgi:hypothetical protein